MSELTRTATMPTSSKRLFIQDVITNRSFLIDPGSDISIIKTSGDGSPVGIASAVNGSTINIYGTQRLTIDLQLRRQFTFIFRLANTSTNIIGADFLYFFDLAPRLRTRTLIDFASGITVDGILRDCDQSSVSLVNKDPRIEHLLANIKPKANQVVFHNVEHHILTEHQRPIRSKPRRLNPENLKQAKAYFKEMVDAGICRISSSPWSSPLHIVKKKNGSLRPCGDYRRLNAITVPDAYPIQHIQDFAFNLGGMKMFLTVDIKNAYWNIPVAPESIPKTDLATPFGLYEFVKMPFGLCNAAQSFQRFMDEIFRDQPNIYVYIGDI